MCKGGVQQLDGWVPVKRVADIGQGNTRQNRNIIIIGILTDFSHSTIQCQSKGNWMDPHRLHLSLCFHFSVLMWDKMEKNQKKKKKMLRNALSDGPSAPLRPLYNSNMAEVSTVKWSQNLICSAQSPKDLKNVCKAGIS